MGFLSRRFEQEGSGLPAPQTGWARFFYLIGTFFWKLVGLNLLTVVFSVPVITMPAAICAAFRVCILLIRNGNVFLWSDFWEEFRRSFMKSLLTGLAASAVLFGGYFLMSLGAGNASLPLWSLLFWVFGICLTFFSITWGCYTHALIAVSDQKLPVIMKNALLLIPIRPGHALAVFAVVIIMLFITTVLFPLSLFLFVFCLLSLAVFTISWIVNTLAEEFILRKPESESSEMENQL